MPHPGSGYQPGGDLAPKPMPDLAKPSTASPGGLPQFAEPPPKINLGLNLKPLPPEVPTVATPSSAAPAAAATVGSIGAAVAGALGIVLATAEPTADEDTILKNLAKPQTKQQETLAVPFTGGQCQGEKYYVWVRDTFADNPGTEAHRVYEELWGPILGSRAIQSPNGSWGYQILAHGSPNHFYNEPFLSEPKWHSYAGADIYSPAKPKFSIIDHVEKMDGSPDICGDPAPAPNQKEQPFAPFEILAPSTLPGTNLAQPGGKTASAPVNTTAPDIGEAIDLQIPLPPAGEAANPTPGTPAQPTIINTMGGGQIKINPDGSVEIITPGSPTTTLPPVQKSGLEIPGGFPIGFPGFSASGNKSTTETASKPSTKETSGFPEGTENCQPNSCMSGIATNLGGALAMLGALLSLLGDKDKSALSCPVPDYSELYKFLMAIHDSLTKKINAGIEVLALKIDKLESKINDIYAVVGVDDFPITVPSSLISKHVGFTNQLEPNPNITIRTLPRFIQWFVEQFDAVAGQFEIPIEVKDSDPTTPGDQPAGVKLPNIAETLAEIYGQGLQTAINTETLVNIATRTMLQTGSDSQQNYKTYRLCQAISDYMGFGTKQVKAKFPLLFKPDEQDLDKLLKEYEQDVQVVDLDEKTDQKVILADLAQAAAIIRGVHWRKLKPTDGSFTQGIIEVIKGLAKVEESTSSDKKDADGLDEFDKRLEEIERGFIDEPGASNTTKPYGQDISVRPRIKKIGDNMTDDD